MTTNALDTVLNGITPRWEATRFACAQSIKEDADLIDFGHTILDIELNDINKSSFMVENKMLVKSSFSSDRNSMKFKNEMLDRYRHLGDTLIGKLQSPLRVLGSESAAGFAGVDMHIRLKKRNGNIVTLPGLLAFLPLDTDDCEECVQLFSFNPIEPKVLVHIARADFPRRVLEACAWEAMLMRL